MLIIIYLFVCCIVGLAGRKRRPGFAGYVLLSIFLTPILPLIYLLLTQKRFLEVEAAKRLPMTVCRSCANTHMASTHIGPAALQHCIRCGAHL